MPAGKCANCDAAVSYFARACPSCGLPNQPNIVTTIAALALLVMLGGAFYVGARAFPWERPSNTTTNTPQTTTAEPAKDDYGWLVQAMAECDVYAKQNADTLYFLIIPLARSGTFVVGWDPVAMGRIGPSVTLVSSSDALIGLRNGVFVLYRKPFTFAVKDATTQTIYKWKPSTGVSELKSRESGYDSLTLGLQVGDSADIEWGPTFTIVKGTCYWTNPVIVSATSRSAPPAPAPR
jgi:hypothetical protein